ncbi:PREDICTED: uncharacterized protein LOC109238165 [Nicotiana attenuata]|uniref:uncharacterized protein LOC109238165 n=1 Tax=Nicotiana attenuata TaxID=49451 RepID=UPI000905B42E|nr:PREDICTED: uncharacterized protein LOC109238165 [Nicotiana attenuata]
MPFISDHAPMSLTLTVNQGSRKTPFKFFNVWTEHERFLTDIQQVWPKESTGRGSKNITTNCSDELLLEEKRLVQNLEKRDMIEEGALKQKARAKWIKLGDSNIKYFSAVMKERSQRNQILELNSINGSRLTDPENIKREIVEFYKSLMGTAAQSLPAIDKRVMHKGSKLNQQERIDLSLPIIKDEITEAVLKFFATGKLFRAINCTAITLVSKVNKPKSVKEFRPIACCTVVYKMISKILASRMQGIISTIINEAQGLYLGERLQIT